MRALLPMLAVLMSGCATTGDTQGAVRDLDKALAGRTPGTPVDCIDRNFASGPQIIDGSTLLYQSGRQVWRNDLEAQCPSLRPTSVLIIEAHGSQMCRNDLFRATESGSAVPGPICRLGRFTPYEKPKG
ncbi:MAG: hypothetical protein V4610_05185 [Pseudomonadota bacterium]|jgi:hypothetical protein|uniref:Lipoprotein n=1 Tax=hydrothermal vent metagenome TaxID=652676 RepID=A0A161KCT4_9ZZZZ